MKMWADYWFCVTFEWQATVDDRLPTGCFRTTNSAKQPGMLAPLSQLAARSVVSGPGFEASAKVVSTVDEREMRKGLRKVSKLAALFGIVLFG
jgi:hypothetical protein